MEDGIIRVRYHSTKYLITHRPQTMIRTQISFDEALYERAKRSARQQGVSLAELCRRSVAAAVSQEPSNQPWMAFIGSVDGSPDDSVSVDAVVYDRDAP